MIEHAFGMLVFAAFLDVVFNECRLTLWVFGPKKKR